MRDKNKKPIYVGDILSYVNEKYPEVEQPLHGIVWSKKINKYVPTVKRGKKYSSWKPSDKPIRKWKLHRWEVIGNMEDNTDLLCNE